jgi:uncharacterized damage-inducible protein DinB
MGELTEVLAGDSAHARPANILEQIAAGDARRTVPGAPHTIYEELWHMAYWQQVTLDWVRGIETVPHHGAASFPAASNIQNETWDDLHQRFFQGNREAIAVASDVDRLDVEVRCPSRPGLPTRLMTVREQLESLGAHNAYHFGRIVLLRQLLGLWPPPSGGFDFQAQSAS